MRWMEGRGKISLSRMFLARDATAAVSWYKTATDGSANRFAFQDKIRLYGDLVPKSTSHSIHTRDKMIERVAEGWGQGSPFSRQIQGQERRETRAKIWWGKGSGGRPKCAKMVPGPIWGGLGLGPRVVVLPAHESTDAMSAVSLARRC